MVEEYVTKQRSMEDIAQELGITDSAIDYWLRKHGIKARTTSEVRAIKHWGSKGEANGMHGRIGDTNPNWKGGVTPERQAFYTTKAWKKACYNVWHRDNATCQVCLQHTKTIGPMAVHHVESFAVVDKRADEGNLILLCVNCHNWVHSRENVHKVYIIGDHP